LLAQSRVHFDRSIVGRRDEQYACADCPILRLDRKSDVAHDFKKGAGVWTADVDDLWNSIARCKSVKQRHLSANVGNRRADRRVR